MRILALETSGLSGSAAILGGGTLIAQTELLPGGRSAQTLLPAVAKLVSQVGWQPEDLQLIAVTQGPGSFTGLRVGTTAAKTLAYAVGAEVLGVDTLEAIALQAPATAQRVWAVMDAQREQLYAAVWNRGSGGELLPEVSTHIVDGDRWLAVLDAAATLSGTGLSRWADRLPSGLSITPREDWNPRAATVGQLAWRQYLAGRRGDLWKLAPNYFRSSAAEEKKAKS